MKRTFTKIFTAVLTLIGVQAFAQTTLSAGDIAFIGYATDGPDRFAFVTLVDLQANTIIKFTDNTFLNNDSLASNENTVVWTSPATVITAGAVISIVADTAAGAGHANSICNLGSATDELDGLSGTGDQILAYQGAAHSETFIAALSSKDFVTTCSTTTGMTNNNNTCLPTPLVDQSNAIGFSSEKDNGYYDCATFPTSGNKLAILASVNDATHWIRSDSNQVWPTCNFSIVTSAKQITNAVSLKAFPNPSATGVFTLSKNANVQIYNLVGVNVLNVANTNSIDLSGFGAGVYLVKTNNGEMIKIVKSN